MNLANIENWKQYLGLLPIHLKALDDPKYIMLNGGESDFCLQLNSITQQEDYFSQSWCSSTKNFLVIEETKIKIYNWYRRNHEEVDLNQVINNFEKFYSYLQQKSYKSEKDIVPFIVDIFRQFRNITLEKNNPVEALNLLFLLLTSLETDSTRLDTEIWNIEHTAIPSGFDYFIDKLQAGINNIRPDLDTILRHSASILFQEAQKEILFFSPQINLFGEISNKLEAKNLLYTSLHYTPPYLARTIVENSLRLFDLSHGLLKIFDPACGSSEFLIEILKQLKELNYAGSLEIKGWDSSETAINTSKFIIKYEQRTYWQNRLSFDFKLVEDSLSEEWSTDWDIILMNPPFVSWELLSKNSRETVRETLGDLFTGKPNQASAFFYKSVISLKENGVLGSVIPSSILTLDSYKKFRSFIEERSKIEFIGKLGNFVFENAFTDVSMIICKREQSESIPTMLWTRNEKGIAQSALQSLRKMIYSNQMTVDEEYYSIFQPISFPVVPETWKPISFQDNKLLKKLRLFTNQKRLILIKDVFSVQQGIRTGFNNAFKISKGEYLKIPETERKFFKPVADNDSVKNGTINIYNYVWYPYNENEIIIETEEQFAAKAPYFYNLTIGYKDILSKRARKDNSNWWHLSEHRAWLRKSAPRLLSTEFGNSDSFAFDKKGDYVVERGYAWLPVSKKEEDFKNVDLYYFYLAIFSSTFFDRLLSIFSKQLAGGNWYDLGKNYTSGIPVPSISNSQTQTEESLILHVKSPIFLRTVEYGKAISNGAFYERNGLEEIVLNFLYKMI